MMKKHVFKALVCVVLLAAITVTLPGIAAANEIFPVVINGGYAKVLQFYYELKGNATFTPPDVSAFSNADIVQFYVESEQSYELVAKSDIQDTSIFNFQKEDIRGWNETDGYQYVVFGRYIQDVVNEPIIWRVLGVKNGKALLMSEYILDTRPFDSTSNEWESSDIKKWLNSSFYKNVFSDVEKAAIVSNGEIGKVFLPSRGELTNEKYGFNKKYTEKDRMRSASGTMYAVDNHLWVVNESEYTNYYARTKANSKNVDLVTASGKIMLGKVERDNVGIRPAIWIQIDALSFSSGDGTLGFPYQ